MFKNDRKHSRTVNGQGYFLILIVSYRCTPFGEPIVKVQEAVKEHSLTVINAKNGQEQWTFEIPCVLNVNAIKTKNQLFIVNPLHLLVKLTLSFLN